MQVETVPKCARCFGTRRVKFISDDAVPLCVRCRRCRQCRVKIGKRNRCVRGEGITAMYFFHKRCAEPCRQCRAWSCEADLVYENGGTEWCGRHCHHCHALDPLGASRCDDLVFCAECVRTACVDHCELCAEWTTMTRVGNL